MKNSLSNIIWSDHMNYTFTQYRHYHTRSGSAGQASFVLQWSINCKHCSFRWWVFQASCRRRFLNAQTLMELCATAISAPHMLSTLFRQQVETQIGFLGISLSLFPFISYIFLSFVVWFQRRVFSASSAASQRNFSDCLLLPQRGMRSWTLRAQLVCHCKTITFDE